jgi:hypothetical protein
VGQVYSSGAGGQCPPQWPPGHMIHAPILSPTEAGWHPHLLECGRCEMQGRLGEPEQRGPREWRPSSLHLPDQPISGTTCSVSSTVAGVRLL